MLDWTAEARESLDIDVELPALNGSSRARAALAGGRSIEEVYRQLTAEAERTFSHGAGA